MLSDDYKICEAQNGQEAVELLADPKLRIGDIGALVGINNVNTFLRQFKKYTGMTPREYRLRKLSMQ